MNRRKPIIYVSADGISSITDRVNAATSEIVNESFTISGLLERVKQNQATPKTEYVNWRTVRSDV